MLVDAAQSCDEVGLRRTVQGFERNHAPLRKGCREIQCRAISTRRQVQTRSWRWTWSRKRASEARRAGRPASRQCRPIESIFGVSAPSAYSVSNASRRYAKNCSPLLNPWAEQFFAYRSEEHTSELQSLTNLVCRLLLEKKEIKLELRCVYIVI